MRPLNRMSASSISGSQSPTPEVTAPLRREDWGLTRYAEALERQLDRVEARRTGRIGDTLAFTEHHPVYTIGRRRHAQRHLVATADFLRQQGIEVHETNRGGDITYHGPGQIVGYLFVDLSRRRDLHELLRTVERALLDTLLALGLQPSIRPELTGVWLGHAKVAAIGMGARQWVSFHGFALNLNPRLDHFSGIVPCGITDGTVTSLSEAMESPPPADLLKDLLFDIFSRHVHLYQQHGISSIEPTEMA